MKPTRIKVLSEKKIIMTAAGENHSLFLSDLGEVLSSGFNEYGELGIGANTAITTKINMEDDFDEELQKQQIETKIELTPKLVKGLE
jgi:alpha-tubulin suppressor-like RCC1 family protein